MRCRATTSARSSMVSRLPEMSALALHMERARRAVLLFALAVLAGCYTYVQLPADVRYETVSPPRVLQIVNRTGRPFSVEPSAYGKQQGFSAQSIDDGGSFDVLLQVRRFRVSDGDRTGSHQVLNGPYIAQEGTNTAVIRIRHGELHFITIDLESDGWFVPQTTSAPAVAPLRIELKSFEPKRWFPTGPP